jgi:hypothetical protein
MKFIVRAFAIAVAVNVAALLWMGLVLGDWNPANLDSLVRDLASRWGGQGPLFWVAFVLGLLAFETLLFTLALLISAVFEGVFWPTVAVSLALLGLVGVKAWDIQKSVKRVKKEAVKAAEKAADGTQDALKDAWEKVKDVVPGK